MHYIVKIEVNDFHFIQFGSHGMRHHTKYCDILRSCRSLIEAFLDGSQSFQSSGRVGSAFDLNGHFRSPGVRLFVVFLEENIRFGTIGHADVFCLAQHDPPTPSFAGNLHVLDPLRQPVPHRAFRFLTDDVPHFSVLGNADRGQDVPITIFQGPSVCSFNDRRNHGVVESRNSTDDVEIRGPAFSSHRVFPTVNVPRNATHPFQRQGGNPAVIQRSFRVSLE